MKRKLAALLLISATLLSGCSITGLSSSKASENSSLGTQNSASTENKAGNNSGNSTTDPNKLKPGTTPQLTGVQKAQVNVKVGSTMSKLDESLKSIQDANDVDLSSLK